MVWGSHGMRLSTSRKNRVLRVPDFEPTARQVSEILGGRSEEISQIWVVWGKAVAVSRYQLNPPTENFPETLAAVLGQQADRSP